MPVSDGSTDADIIWKVGAEFSKMNNGTNFLRHPLPTALYIQTGTFAPFPLFLHRFQPLT